MKKSFCSLCNQVLNFKRMECYVSDENHFSKITELVGKVFYFCIFCDIDVKMKKERSHESTQDHYENAEVHLSFRNRASDCFNK